MKTLVIIPTYNEVDSLGPLLNEVFARIPESDILIAEVFTYVLRTHFSTLIQRA